MSQRDYRVDDKGISISNPNGNAPHRVSWETLILALRCLEHWANEKNYGDLTADLYEGAVVVEAAARRAGSVLDIPEDDGPIWS